MTDVRDINKTLSRIANAKRLNSDKVREALDDAEVIRDAAQNYLDREVADAVDNIVNAIVELEPLADLGILINSTKLALLRSVMEDLVELTPDEDEIRAIVEAWDSADEASLVCVDHKENPRDYDPEEKQTARDEAAEAVRDFRDILDRLDVTGTENKEVAK